MEKDKSRQSGPEAAEVGEKPRGHDEEFSTVCTSEGKEVRVLVVFNTVVLYGMERTVIELFDLLRPNVSPHFLLSETTRRLRLPVLVEIQERGLEHSFFSDKTDWPRIGYPESFGHFWHLLVALARGNWDVLSQAKRHDVLYLPSSNYIMSSFVAALYYRLSKKRVVFCFHDLIQTSAVPLKLVSFFVTDFVHNTSFGHEFIARAHPWIGKKRNFISLGRTAMPRTGRNTPNIRPYFEGKRNLLFVGQVSMHKGIDLLLAAFQTIVGDYPDVVLHIVGGCLQEEQFRRTIAESSFENRAYYWGYREDILDLLQLTYLYVHPSPPSRMQESFGRGVVEAMSQGVPTVCFRSGALQELVVHERTGLICEEEKPASLAENIRRFLDRLDFRDSCARSARIRFEECYSGIHTRTKWLKFLGIT